MTKSHDTHFKILLVEDELGDADLTKLALSEGRFTCQVTSAENGREAMSMLRKQPPYQTAFTPDLVLLDINMPLMNGMEVLKEMKADPELSFIPVVVLTTSNAERDIFASYQLGAAGYVDKPLDIQEFFRKIHSVEEYWFDVVCQPRMR